jgi:putative heme-binding domain-containing protein
MIIVRHGILPAIGVMLASWVMPAATNPFANDPQAREAGRLVFRIYCSPCHGIRGEGGSRGPDLTAGHYSIGNTDDALFTVIHDGIPGTGMAAFGGRVIDDNIWRTVVYLQSFGKDQAGVPGDRVKGADLFWGKGGCGECHTIAGKGGRLGPNLSRVGKERGATYVRKAIVSPNPDDPRYMTVTVTTKDGASIKGTARGIDNFSVRLIDSDGNFRSFAKDDLVSVKEERKSAMPQIYGRLFTASELDDLVAYLSSLTGTK